MATAALERGGMTHYRAAEGTSWCSSSSTTAIAAATAAAATAATTAAATTTAAAATVNSKAADLAACRGNGISCALSAAAGASLDFSRGLRASH